MSMAPIGVGIDVGKFDCVVAIQGRTGGLNFPNDPPGIAADLSPGRPSFITRDVGFDSCRFQVGQARR